MNLFDVQAVYLMYMDGCETVRSSREVKIKWEEMKLRRNQIKRERGQGNFFRISTFSLVETSVFFLFEQFYGQCCDQSTAATVQITDIQPRLLG